MLKTLILDNGETHELVETDKFNQCKTCSLLDYCAVESGETFCNSFRNPYTSHYKIINKQQ